MENYEAAMKTGVGSSAETSLQIASPAESIGLARVLGERRPKGSTHVEFAGGGRAVVERKPSKWQPEKTTDLPPGLQYVSKGGRYEEHPQKFIEAATSEGQSVAAMQSLTNITLLGGASPHRSPGARAFAAQQALLKIVEMSRSGQAAVVSMEQAQMVGQSVITHSEGVRADPMTVKDAVSISQGLERRTEKFKGDGDIKTRSAKLKAMIEKQIHFIATVMEAQYGAQNIMFKDEYGLTQAVRDDVQKAVKRITEQNLGLVPEQNIRLE